MLAGRRLENVGLSSLSPTASVGFFVPKLTVFAVAGSGLTVSFGENATAQVASRVETEEAEEGEPGGIEGDYSSSDDSDDDRDAEEGALVRTGRSR